ncbi:MAG TPA: hypothetical protein VFL91_11070, partial [Thermomicrobiales bacterium]|nr:hypothetical protein [Thermomicrobiales bacterium]
LLRAAGRDAAGLLRACYAALLLTLAAWPFFMPWYAAWVVPLAAALGQAEEAYQVVAFGAAAAASYLCQYSLRQASPHSVWFWSAASALAVFGTLAPASVPPRRVLARRDTPAVLVAPDG